jgi:hypothetical protein
MYVYSESETRSSNHCRLGKAISITYSECAVVALVIQHANPMRQVILLSVACLDLTYLSTLSHKRHHLQKGRGLLNIKCEFLFPV